MSSILISQRVIGEFGAQLEAIVAAAPRAVEILPFDAASPPAAERIASLEAAYYSRDIWEGTARSALSSAAHAFWQTIERSPALAWMHVFSSGTDHVQYQSVMQRRTRITTGAGAQAEPVAHAAVTGLLALARRFPHYWAAQQRSQWMPLKADSVPDLRGQHAVIVGTGHIGKIIAGCLRAFGIRTTGVRRRVAPTEPFDAVVGLAALDAMLPECDWLVLACPLVAETRGLVDARRLSLLPPRAGLVNVARGEIVDEAALAQVLEQGTLCGAYLDVFSAEPLATDSPFWRLPNTIVSPHNAGASSGTYRRGVEIFLRNFERYLHAESLENEAPAAPL